MGCGCNKKSDKNKKEIIDRAKDTVKKKLEAKKAPLIALKKTPIKKTPGR